MAISILKNSFRSNSTYTPENGTDEISLLGQKVTYKIDVSSENDYRTNKYLYILTYSLMVISLGSYETFGAAIYTELSRQLDVGTDVIAFILTSKSISLILSAISCAWITDHFRNTHRYISLTMLSACISMIIIPHTHNTPVMYILFIIIGYSLGSIYVCFPVYIFRLYPTKQSLMIYILLSIYGSTKVILPLFIELNISLTGHYDLALYFIAIIGLFDCIFLLFVITPEHDNLRTIKADISNKRRKKSAKTHLVENMNRSFTDGLTSFGNVSDDHTTSDTICSNKGLSHMNQTHNNQFNDNTEYIDEQESTTELLESQTELEDISNQMQFVLRNNKKHVIYTWIMVVLLSIDMALFSAGQSGATYFITTYCDSYLNINEANGRFMISCYFLGQLVYRLIFAVFIGDKYKKKFSPNKTIAFGFVVMTFFSLMFVIWPKNIIVLYVIYSICGAFGGGIFPDIYKWCESMRPVSGILSCFYIIGFALGDAIIILIIGEMFAILGAYILPYPILVTNFIGLWLTVCISVMYTKYQHNKSAILSTFYHGQ